MLMHAMVLSTRGERLKPQERPDPEPRLDEVRVFPLDQADEALAHLREGKLVGAAVLRP